LDKIDNTGRFAVSIRLYVGNLPKELEREELEAVFAGEGEGVSTKLVTDKKTGKCRGFAFVTVPTDELADVIIEKFNGFALKETQIKIEKALPRTKSKGDEAEGDESVPATPTPVAAAVVSNSPPPVAKRSGGKGKSGSNRRPAAVASSGSSTSTEGGGFQPDPRWASVLEQLKDRLAETGA
jgi:RNA recognition motif-containing protein